jgi:hypothetical protein
MSARRLPRHASVPRALACALALSLLVGPIPTARAAGGGGGSESRVGVLLAAVCGLALKASLPAPVPWAGIAAVTCMFAFLDAAMSPDDAAPPQDPPPRP